MIQQVLSLLQRIIFNICIFFIFCKHLYKIIIIIIIIIIIGVHNLGRGTAIMTSINSWNLEDMVRAKSFNTTVSNNGNTNCAFALYRRNWERNCSDVGVGIIIPNSLCTLLSLSACDGSEALLSMRCQEQRGCIDQHRFSTALDNTATARVVSVLATCHCLLENSCNMSLFVGE